MISLLDDLKSFIRKRVATKSNANVDSIVRQAQLSQRDRAAGFVTVFAKSRRLELGDNILRTL